MLTTELHLQSLSVSETRRQFDVFCDKLMCFLLINKLNGADCFPLQISATYFLLKIWRYWCQYYQNMSKSIVSCCFMEELRETSKRWIVTVEAWFIICGFMSGELWWMSGLQAEQNIRDYLSRWVPGPKDEGTHLAEVLSASKTDEFGSPFGLINLGILTF